MLVVAGGIVMFVVPGAMIALPAGGFVIFGLGCLTRLGGKAALNKRITATFKKLMKAIEKDVEANNSMKEELAVCAQTDMSEGSIRFGDRLLGHEEAVKRYLEEVGEVVSESYDSFCDRVEDDLPPVDSLMDVDHGFFVRKLERSLSKRHSRASTAARTSRSASSRTKLKRLISRTTSAASANVPMPESSDSVADSASVASNSTEFTLLSAESITSATAAETSVGSLAIGPEAFVAGFEVYDMIKRHRGDEGDGGRLVYAGWESGGEYGANSREFIISWKGRSRYTL